MNLFPKWMRPDSSQRPDTIEGESRLPATAGVSEHQKTGGDWLGDESSYSWNATDSFEWDAKDLRIPDSSNQGHLTRQKHDSDTTAPATILSLEESSAASCEENRGVDPYNTGRFESK